MSLPHLLLGLLREPKSGYEIKQQFDQNLSHFWSAELAQLYPALKKLVAEGLADVEEQASDKGPDKKVYSRTGLGQKALEDWLTSGLAKAPGRNPNLAKIFFMGELPEGQDGAGFFKELKERFGKTRNILEAIERQWDEEDPYYPNALPDDEFYMQLTLEAGIEVHRTYEAWCDRAIARIEGRR